MALCCACGGGGGGGASFDGTVDGVAYPIVDVISAVTGSGTPSAAVIEMSTEPDLCSRIASDTQRENEKTVLIIIANVDAATQTPSAPTSLGAYPIMPGSASGPSSIFDTTVTGSDCNATGGADAASGAVTLDALSDGAYGGSFDVVMADAGSDHVTGSFSGEDCPALADLLNGTTGSGSATCE